MDPLSMALLGGIAGPVVQLGTGLLGNKFAEGDDRLYEEQIRAMLADYERMQGQIDPLLNAEPQQVAESSLSGYQADPAMLAQQRAVLDRLTQMADQGGYTLEDRAALQRMNSQVSRQNQARQNAITGDMQRRGQLGGAAEAVLRAQSAQGANEEASQRGMDQAALGMSRAFDAVLQRGNLAGEMEGQNLDRASRIAAARDAVNSRNAELRNRAREFNVNARMDLGRAGMAARGAQADVYRQRGQNTRNAWGAGGAAAGQAAGGLFDYAKFMAGNKK